MIRVGLVGCGVISVAHLNAYTMIPEVKVTAVCDSIKSLAARTAKKYNIRSYYGSLDDMLKREDVDVIDVCVPTVFHRDVSIKALEAGKHVICEKPIAATLDQADDMIDAAKRSERLLFIGHSNRFLPMVREVMKILESGELGNPLIVRMAHRFDNPFEKWALNPEHPKYYWKKGGGPIIDSGIHGADFINMVFKDKAALVSAKAVAYPPALPFFTSAHIHIEYERGGHGIIEVDRQTRGYPQYERFIEVIGSRTSMWGFDNFYRQTILFNGLSLKELYHGKNLSGHTPTAHKQFIEYLPAVSEIYIELREFIQAIIRREPPPIKPEEARNALEICIAAERSARSEKAVELPLKE